MGNGPAAPPGSIRGSQAIAESRLGVYFPFSDRRFILEQSLAFRKQHKNEPQAWPWADGAPWALQGQSHEEAREWPGRLPADFGLSGHAEEDSQRE